MFILDPRVTPSEKPEPAVTIQKTCISRAVPACAINVELSLRVSRATEVSGEHVGAAHDNLSSLPRWHERDVKLLFGKGGDRFAPFVLNAREPNLRNWRASEQTAPADHGFEVARLDIGLCNFGNWFRLCRA